MTQVLIVEPDSSQRGRYRQILEDGGFVVVEHPSEDLRMPVSNDLLASCHCIIANAASDLLSVAETIPVILVTADPDVREAVAAMKRGAQDYLPLPFPPEELIAAVERGVATARVKSTDSGLTEQLPILGSSPAMRDLMHRIAKVGPTDSTVLIRGESGTGKELVARAIHGSSRRSQSPMISLNCATLPAQLIETELFGYSSSDEDPQKTRRGLVEAANGGTIFLDDIGELSIEAQARLLRVLQAGEVRPFGSAQSFPINVRLIAATQRDLEKLIRNDQFRQDLYYRLNVVALEIPPLREREEDVLLLAAAILERAQQRLGKTGIGISESARRALLDYHWPGNVRELENAIERAVILCDGPDIDAEMLAIKIPGSSSAEAVETDHAQTSLEDYFVSFVLANQDQCTETELAEKLGISRKSLWERRQRLNIPRKKTRNRGPRRERPADPESAAPTDTGSNGNPGGEPA